MSVQDQSYKKYYAVQRNYPQKLQAIVHLIIITNSFPSITTSSNSIFKILMVQFKLQNLKLIRNKACIEYQAGLYSHESQTIYFTFELQAFRSYLNNFDAGTLAGEAVLGSLNSASVIHWTPFVVQNVQTNVSIIVNIRMEHFGFECNFWRFIWIVLWKEHLENENTAFPYCVRRSVNHRIPFKDIIIVGQCSYLLFILFLYFLQIFYQSTPCSCSHLYFNYKCIESCLIIIIILKMSSIGFNRMSNLSAEEEGYIVEQEDDAQFFSIAQQYNERKAKMISQRAMEAMNMIHNFNIKNNPKDPKASEQKQQKTRKTRSDKQGRQYTCGACNRSYLSYPALYTHIKTKHDGITPEGTIRGKNNNNKRRGRPKNLRAQPNLHHRPEPQFLFPKQYCKLVESSQVSFIDAEQQDQDQNQEQTIKIQSQFFQQQIRLLKNSTSPLITLPIIKVITIYLYNVKGFLGERSDVMQTIESVSEKLIKFINANYFKILKQFQMNSIYYIRKQIPENEIYCNYEKCDYVPVFVNWFFKRLDAENDQMQVDFLTDLCAWMNTKKLTHIKLLKPQAIEAGVTLSQE